MNLLTNSAVKMARLCPRKYRLKYVDGIVPVAESEDLDYGTVWHKAQEVWWRHRILDAALTVIDGSSLEAYAKIRASVLMTGYHYRWENEPMRALCIEGEFRMPLVNPDTGRASEVWLVAGKVDLIARNTDTESTWLIEHKTSSEDVSPGSIYHRRLRMDSQASTYYDGARALGYSDIAGCIYDVCGKLALRPLKATPVAARKFRADGKLYANQREFDETPDEYRARCMQSVIDEPDRYYARLDVPRMDADLIEARRDMWAQGQRIHSDTVAGRHPRNPDACMAFGRTCPYFDICSGVVSPEDEGQFRRLTNVHQELSGAALSSTKAQLERGEFP